MKKRFTQEYSEYGKTPCEWFTVYRQELATLLTYPEHQFQRDLHFKDLDNTQVMLDLDLYQILGIIFLMPDSVPSQDLIPDLDLKVSTNQ